MKSAGPSPQSLVRYALIPAAGRGTRVAKLTGGGAKELLEVNGAPVIDHAIREARGSECQKIGVVVREGKEDLVMHLRNEWHNKISLLWQSAPEGLGDAILAGRSFVARSKFAVLLPDDLVYGRGPAIGRLIDCHYATSNYVVGIAGKEEEAHPMFADCGQVGLEPLKTKENTFRARFEDTKETRPVIGRYVFPPEAFEVLERKKGTQSGELGEGVVLRTLAKRNQLVAYSPEGTCFTVGVPEGYRFARTTVEPKM